MKSRITIEVDFENGNEPVIQILSRNSDDIRDNLIKSFYQKLGGSSWCKIHFKQDVMDETVVSNTGNFVEGFKRIFITPISEDELEGEAHIMLEQHRVRKAWESDINKKLDGNKNEKKKKDFIKNAFDKHSL